MYGVTRLQVIVVDVTCIQKVRKITEDVVLD